MKLELKWKEIIEKKNRDFSRFAGRKFSKFYENFAIFVGLKYSFGFILARSEE